MEVNYMIDLYKYENELYEKGLEYIGGVDEVGRGPLIGSVVAACVILPRDFVLEGLTDSKKLSEKKRNEYYKIIKEKAIAIGIAGDCEGAHEAGAHGDDFVAHPARAGRAGRPVWHHGSRALGGSGTGADVF